MEDTEDKVVVEKSENKVLSLAQQSYKYDKGILAMERNTRVLFEACAAYLPKFFETIKLRALN